MELPLDTPDSNNFISLTTVGMEYRRCRDNAPFCRHELCRTECLSATKKGGVGGGQVGNLEPGNLCHLFYSLGGDKNHDTIQTIPRINRAG